eukprot:PITA_03030
MQTPVLTIALPDINKFYIDFSTKVVICRFNGFWPKTNALQQWIYSTWTTNCDIHLCSKGFFIVRFDTVKEREYALHEGPWFWGNVGLFMTPWFPGFDANAMVVSKMSVWVRLHNLPLHFWIPKVFEAMGNAIGKYLKQDMERITRDIHTFARICVEVDLSQGLPDSIILIHNNIQWNQPLDYENTAFRCHGCQKTAKDEDATIPPPNPDDVPIEEEATETIPKVNNQTHKTPETEKSIAQELMDSLPEKIPDTTDTSRTKRQHSPDHSDSDKENPRPVEGTSLILYSSSPTQGEWRKVEKTKGRKA